MEDIQKKNIKILHCGDIHLDAPFIGMTTEKADERRPELRNTFSKMMEFVRERKID